MPVQYPASPVLPPAESTSVAVRDGTIQLRADQISSKSKFASVSDAFDSVQTWGNTLVDLLTKSRGLGQWEVLNVTNAESGAVVGKIGTYQPAAGPGSTIPVPPGAAVPSLSGVVVTNFVLCRDIDSPYATAMLYYDAVNDQVVMQNALITVTPSPGHPLGVQINNDSFLVSNNVARRTVDMSAATIKIRQVDSGNAQISTVEITERLIVLTWGTGPGTPLVDTISIDGEHGTVQAPTIDCNNLYMHTNVFVWTFPPTTYPGAGSFRVWADPADGYRLKWAQ